jgi:hypothetical protein
VARRIVAYRQFRAPYIARKPVESAKYFGYLKAHGIAVAAVMALMPAETCGQGVEGIISHKGIDFYPRAIKNAGVQLDYVVMDEPLYFGHDYAGKDACKLPIADVAKGVAESVATIRSYHPRANSSFPSQSKGSQAALPNWPNSLMRLRRRRMSTRLPFGSMCSGARIGAASCHHRYAQRARHRLWCRL